MAAPAPTVWIVDSSGDTGGGSGQVGDLRYCVNQANKSTNPAGSLIEFAAQPFAKSRTINLLFGPLTLSNVAAPVSILGPGQSKLAINALGAGSVLDVERGVTAMISGLTVEGGSARQYGGGISSDGDLSLVNCSIVNNSVSTTRNGDSPSGGAGLYNGPDGTLSVQYCTIGGNTLTNNRNAANPGSGGGVLNVGTAAIADSSISGNSAVRGSGGGIANVGTLTLVDDTIAGNSTSQGGSGGGLLNFTGLTAVNCTIAGNVVQGAGAIGGGADLVDGSATLVNTIVAQNTFGAGGRATASDLAAGEGALDLADSGYDLVGTGGSGGLVDGSNGNLVGVADPGLGRLANNGGPTETIAPEAGSVAIGAGNPDAITNPPFPGPPTSDQRGPGFARVVAGKVDIGAYQTQG